MSNFLWTLSRSLWFSLPLSNVLIADFSCLQFQIGKIWLKYRWRKFVTFPSQILNIQIRICCFLHEKIYHYLLVSKEQLEWLTCAVNVSFFPAYIILVLFSSSNSYLDFLLHFLQRYLIFSSLECPSFLFLVFLKLWLSCNSSNVPLSLGLPQVKELLDYTPNHV